MRFRVQFLALLGAGVVAACGGGDAAQALGEAADPADADRTIEVSALDSLEFDPDDIEVEVGETITFTVTNEGDLEHEFVLGAPSEHAGHGGGGSNHLHLTAGVTDEIAWTFDEAGEVKFACYVDGHDQSGMTGVITVK